MLQLVSGLCDGNQHWVGELVVHCFQVSDHHQVQVLLGIVLLPGLWDEVVVLSDEGGHLLVHGVPGVAVDVGEGLGDDGDQEVEHDDHVEDSAEQEESDHQSKGNTTFVVTSIEASQNDVVNVDDGVHEATGEHICSNIFIPSCDTEERAPKGDEPNQEHQQEAPHIRNNHNDHSDEVASVAEDPHEVKQLQPHEEGCDRLDGSFQLLVPFQVQNQKDDG
mmetsp:Transcript_28425/g.27382  ORF Transcript_28425/g.27382 Transcript_28425/m.27382 type:complete len:220 (-) Transcript_28425:1287-1946(-)